MTENKRYIAREESIINMETDELVNAFDEWAAEIVVDWLNELSEKNRQLKEENYVLQDGLDFYKEENGSLTEEISNLEDENEWLKTQIENISAQSDEFYRGARENANCLGKLEKENEQLKKEKEYWKSNSCSQSNYLSILSMDCWIVEEAIFNLKNVIDVDTEAYNLLDELSDKFNELQEHRINWGYNLSEEEKQDVIKYLRAYND